MTQRAMVTLSVGCAWPAVVRVCDLAIVALAARELSMLFGAFFGARFLCEGEVLPRVACAVLIGVGVAMIALSR